MLLLTSRFAKYNKLLHVISRKRLREAVSKHRDLEEPLDNWFKTVKRAAWMNISDVKVDFPHADAVGRCTVFNLKGNKYRLISKIVYRWGRVFIKRVLKHA